MKGIFTKELEEIEQNIINGHYSSALKRTNYILEEEKSTKEEKIRSKIFKAQVYREKSLFSEAIKYGEEAFEESKELGNQLLMVDSLIQLPFAYFLAGKYELRKEKVRLANQILDSFTDKTSEAYLKREAKLLPMGETSFDISLTNLEKSISIARKLGLDVQLALSYFLLGSYFLWLGELKEAEVYAQKSITLSEKLSYFFGYSSSLFLMAVINLHKGELDLALDFFLKSLSIAEEVDDNYYRACTNMDLGYLYWLKRDLNTSLKHYQESLKQFKKAKVIGTRHYPWALFRMNLVLIEMDRYDEASRNLEQIELLSLLKEATLFKKIYNLAKAVILRTRKDETSWNEIVTLLEEVEDDDTIHLELDGLRVFYLCDSYFKIIRKTNDLKTYEKLRKRIDDFAQLAEKEKSYILLAQSLLIKSKLKLIDLDIEGSRLLLEKAQDIADTKGVMNLAKQISNEYDVLINDLSRWEEMSTYLPTLEERFEFTHIEDLFEKMIKNNITYADVIDEEESPLFLLILNKEGSILFSQQFSEIFFGDVLIQDVLGSLQTFKSEPIINDGIIKRLKYKKYSIAITKLGKIMLAYVFIGKSYYAVKKLKYLIVELQTFSENWQKIAKEEKELDLDDRIEMTSYIEKNISSLNLDTHF